MSPRFFRVFCQTSYSRGVAVSQTSPVWATKAGLGVRAAISRKAWASLTALPLSTSVRETWESVMWTKVKSARATRGASSSAMAAVTKRRKGEFGGEVIWLYYWRAHDGRQRDQARAIRCGDL